MGFKYREESFRNGREPVAKRSEISGLSSSYEISRTAADFVSSKVRTKIFLPLEPGMHLALSHTEKLISGDVVRFNRDAPSCPPGHRVGHGLEVDRFKRTCQMYYIEHCIPYPRHPKVTSDM